MTIKLVPVRMDDAKFLFETKNDKEFAKYFPEMLVPKTIEEQEREIREVDRNTKRGLWKYYIITNGKNKVGFFDIYKINHKHKRCSIGYGIAREKWGAGYATVATKKALKEIKKLGIHTAEATSHPKNISSQKVLEKNGFIKIGLMKDYYYSNSKYVDRVLYWKVL